VGSVDANLFLGRRICDFQSTVVIDEMVVVGGETNLNDDGEEDGWTMAWGWLDDGEWTTSDQIFRKERKKKKKKKESINKNPLIFGYNFNYEGNYQTTPDVVFLSIFMGLAIITEYIIIFLPLSFISHECSISSSTSSVYFLKIFRSISFCIVSAIFVSLSTILTSAARHLFINQTIKIFLHCYMFFCFHVHICT